MHYGINVQQIVNAQEKLKVIILVRKINKKLDKDRQNI